REHRGKTSRNHEVTQQSANYFFVMANSIAVNNFYHRNSLPRRTPRDTKEILGALSSMLFLSFHQKAGQRFQLVCPMAEAVERGASRVRLRIGLLKRLFNSKKGRIRSFLRGGVFACGLAQLLGGLGDVKNVVDDLERQPNILPERPEFSDCLVICSGIQPAADQAGGNQRCG